VLDLRGLLIRGAEGRADERGGDVKGRGGEEGKGERRREEWKEGEMGMEGKGSYRYFFFPLQAMG